MHQARSVVASNYFCLFQTRIVISVVGQSLGSNITQTNGQHSRENDAPDLYTHDGDLARQSVL